MAKPKKPSGITFGNLRRRKSDTNGVWGILANEDAIHMSSSRIWRLPAWLLPTLGVAAVATLIALCVFVAGLYQDKPNVSQVVSQARESTFEVFCGNASGSGVAIEVPLPDGYKTAVFSAAHIFEECREESKVQIVADGKTYDGLLYRKDPQTAFESNDSDLVNDIALIYLKYDLPKLQAAPAAVAGDWAIVVGNPWNEINYATFGIITAVTHDEYATDAAINPGNSGGPILDSKGRVLGLISYRSMHSESDIDSRNKSPILDIDPGMGYAKRLRLACDHLYSGVIECPFEY